jgi:hypothetical protein
MNNAPVVCEDYTQRMVDIYGNPHFEKITNPEIAPLHITTILQDEDKAFKDEPGYTSLRLLAAPSISADEKTVYALLSDIVCPLFSPFSLSLLSLSYLLLILCNEIRFHGLAGTT